MRTEPGGDTAIDDLAAATDSDLLDRADGMPPRHRDALLQGLLDAARIHPSHAEHPR